MNHYAIIGGNSKLVIGVCTDAGIDDVRKEEPNAVLEPITPAEFRAYSKDEYSVIPKSQRIKIANDIIRLIGGCGRNFFNHQTVVSHFVLVSDRLRFHDSYSRKSIYVAYPGKWRGFTNGGTMRSLIENLRDFITHRAPIKAYFGPWPEWVCEGDLWGYGKETMETLRADLQPLLERAAKCYAVPKKKLAKSA